MGKEFEGHTPGPWIFRREEGDNHIDSEDRKLTMCDTQYYPWIQASEADWKLIAAAPTLLAERDEALEALRAIEEQLTKIESTLAVWRRNSENSPCIYR